MDEEFLALLADLHKGRARQGPGGEAETDRAMAWALADIDPKQRLKIADIGCGTGAATLRLAAALNADIAAVDLLPEFINVLNERAQAAGLADKVSGHVCAMEDLPFADGAFDVVWSEGAIYNMGFKRGVEAWRWLLKPGGVLVASDITWITGRRPAELQAFWEGEYPEIDTASAKLAVLEAAGYAPIGYFTLPERCWLENYYLPLQAELPDFLARHGNDAKAVAIADAEAEEQKLYRENSAYYSYGVYIARRTDEQSI